jgi:heme-degrading monooxygenase HmoA
LVVVVFEVWLKASERHRYFDIAAELRPELEKIDGFISVERFRSLNDEGKYVSLSFWQDEAAVQRWRQHARHGGAQRLGRSEIFADFRITVASVIRSYTMADPPPHGDRHEAAPAASGIGPA